MISGKMKFWWCIFCICGILSLAIANADETATETLLMFVGEDQNILTIASGREESAWQAPAVAVVIEQNDFRQKQYTTLTEAIGTVAGFHIVESASKIHTYLRGIPESSLYLYDTVPMKLPDNIFLHSIKRVEIIRGPGSVLWGPDAFAGIVNAVPLTGRDLDGAETGLLFSSEDSWKGAYLNHGWNRGVWDGFLSLSGSTKDKEDFSADITNFWGEGNLPVPVDERRGMAAEEYGQQMEINGNFSFRDNFKISGRFADFKDPYSISHQNPFSISNQVDDIQWKEVRNEKAGFLKVEGKKQFDINSGLRFTASISMFDSERKVIDTILNHEEYETYGEITYEKVFNSGDSHLTSGISFRKKEYNGITVWDTYLPNFLVDENDSFLPAFSQNDFTTKLWSFFTQYRMTLGPVDFIFGVRQDEHDSFENNLSYNTGLIWKPADNWICKALMGTAYRTPSPRQLFDDTETRLEEIKNISLEISRKFGQKAEFSIGGFISEIDNHVMDDPYAGLSTPNAQRIRGIELSGSVKPTKWLTISANFTWLENNGPLETYLFNDFSTLLPDGTVEKHFVTFEYPYDTGPEIFSNLNFVWVPKDRFEIFVHNKYFLGYELTYPYVGESVKCDTAWLMDVGIRIKNVLVDKSDLGIKLINIFNRQYTIPGEYSLEQGDPFSISIVWRKRW